MRYCQTVASTYVTLPINMEKPGDIQNKTYLKMTLKVFVYSRSMQVKVVHAASLKSEYLVNLDEDLILPCYDYDPSLSVDVTWSLNGHLITGSQLLNNGSIHIKK